MVAGIQFDCSGFGKLDSIGQQVIQYLFDTIHITVQIDIGILEIRFKQYSFIRDNMRKARSNTFQQVIKTERDIVSCFFCLVQTVHIQKVVQQMILFQKVCLM